MSHKPLLRYTLLALCALVGILLLFWPRPHETTALAIELPIELLWAAVSLWGVRVFSQQRGFLADTVPVELTSRLHAVPGEPRFWESGPSVAVAIAWNCGLCALLNDARSWRLVLGLLFAAGSLWISLGLLIPVLQRRRMGDTLIEMNRESIQLNQNTKLRIKQLGEGEIAGFSARLVCEEMARAGDGKAARTERCVVAEYPIVEASNISVTRAKRAVFEKEIQLPPDAMHSFRSTCNSIEWYVRIELKAALMPVRSQSFEVPVRVGRPD